ncbi:MAG: phosphopantothenate/pantothenate synthetase [Candidatus Hodarchaeota archaeon]
MNDHVPNSHPRAVSLRTRHVVTEGWKKKVVTTAGLYAHGRGEAFDYLIGEKTIEPAIEAMEAAVAMMLTAGHPVISINGNVAALCPADMVQLAEAVGAKLEINLFYREEGRLEAIEKVLKDAGATEILGLQDVEPETIANLESNRRIVDPRGIAIADVVMVPLEDGDRTEALRKVGKKIIAIDLNPLSRTAQWAHVTICDNIIRCGKKMVDIAKRFKEEKTEEQLKVMVASYDNAKVLSSVIKTMVQYLSELGKKGVFLELPENE